MGLTQLENSLSAHDIRNETRVPNISCEPTTLSLCMHLPCAKPTRDESVVRHTPKRKKAPNSLVCDVRGPSSRLRKPEPCLVEMGGIEPPSEGTPCPALHA